MPEKYIAVSAMGHDRVGLADDIVSWIESAGGNVEGSKMSVLGGEFAVIILVSGKAGSVEKLISEADAQSDSIGVKLCATTTSAPHAIEGGRPYLVESFSLDSPGIVHSITHEIRSLGISIEDLDTSSSPAPWTGAPVFKMKARVILPSSQSVADFRDHMENLAHERDLDIRLEPV
ncbi:MAG: amino acid-binding protein [Spirochaetaceae bacterium]|nr:amino acid-binding protein [Spirochaetaceae bacterium]